jgi:hypothetical protein
MRETLRAVELDQQQRELASVHPILLQTRPDVRAVVLRLTNVRLTRDAVRTLEPVFDPPSLLPLVEDAGESCGMLGAAFRLAPANSQTYFRLPEVEPGRDLPRELVVDERVDELEHVFVLHAHGDEIHLGPGFHSALG